MFVDDDFEHGLVASLLIESESYRSPFAMSCKRAKPDAAGRRWGRVHKLPNGLKEIMYGLVMTFELAFQFGQLLGQVFVRRQQFSQAHECTDHVYASLNGTPGVEDIRCHDRAVFSEGVGSVTTSATPFL